MMMVFLSTGWSQNSPEECVERWSDLECNWVRLESNCRTVRQWVSLVPESLDVLGTETGHCERGFSCWALLHVFEKLLLVSLCFCPSVRPSVHMEQICCHRTNFHDVSYLLLFENISEKCFINAGLEQRIRYRGADKSLARPGRKLDTATGDFDVHISYL
jgi:hypothetical protein